MQLYVGTGSVVVIHIFFRAESDVLPYDERQCEFMKNMNCGKR